MEKMMKVAVMHGKQDVAMEQRPVPSPKRGEVLIRIQTVGICGSDLHYYTEGKIGDVEVQMPFILGHEVAGVIEELGEDVRDLRVGDLVAVEAGLPCGTCEFCRSGHYNLCEKMRFLATPPVDGAFSEYLAYPADWVYRMPENLTAAEGALIEPLAVGLHAAEIAGTQLGDTAFIFGCGCIGLITLLALRSRGVSQIYMSDVLEARMEKARELGATRVFDAGSENVTERVMEMTGGRGVDSVYEMTGAKPCLMQTVDVARKGGVIVLVGLGPESVMPFNFEKLIWKQVQIRPCFRYQNIYPKAIRALAGGLINVNQIISDRVKLEEVPEALRYHIQKKNSITKMIVEMGSQV